MQSVLSYIKVNNSSKDLSECQIYDFFWVFSLSPRIKTPNDLRFLPKSIGVHAFLPHATVLSFSRCSGCFQILVVFLEPEMKAIIILLTILVVGGAIVWLIDRLFYHKDTPEKVDETEENDSGNTSRQGCADEACGLRSICPSEQLLAGECKQEITYYDDEELDEFAGRDEDSYTPEEEEQWRDVLYTLQPDDLLGWGQSIKHRGLVMPAAVREEFMHLAAEHHTP